MVTMCLFIFAAMLGLVSGGFKPPVSAMVGFMSVVFWVLGFISLLFDMFRDGPND